MTSNRHPRGAGRNWVGTRRQFLARGGAVTFAGLCARPTRAAGTPKARVEALTLISKQPDLYTGWPTLARRRAGELLLVYSGGREAHVCPFGRVELIRSRDGGRSWSWPRVLLDSPIDDRDAGVVETPGGAVLVTTFTSLAFEPVLAQAEARAAGSPGAWPADKLARWRAARDRLSAADRRRELGTWIVRSGDGGVTWSARHPVPVNSPHGPVVLSGGRLLYAGKELWQDPPRNGVCLSTDDGRTWQGLVEIPTRPGDDPRQYHELHAVETADGRLLVHLRNHNRVNPNETLQSESADGGRTWSVPHPIGVWGYPSHLLRLKDGRLLMTYGHRRPPLGNQARLSTDGGRTWSAPLVLSDDGASTDLGYPSTVEMDDGSLVTVWYETVKGAKRAGLRQAQWWLES